MVPPETTKICSEIINKNNKKIVNALYENKKNT